MKKCLCALLLLSIAIPAHAKTLYVGLHDNYGNTELQIGFCKGCSRTIAVGSCPELLSEKLAGSQRLTTELVIICKAVEMAGIADTIELVPFPNTERAMHLLQMGTIDIMGNSIFEVALARYPEIIATAPIIRKGEFVVGLFTTRNRPEVLAARTVDDFKKLVGVVVHSWYGDIQTMRAFGPKEIMFVPKRGSISKAIKGKHADFTFSYLTEEVVTRIGGELIRIPEVKAGFVGERSFAVSPFRRDVCDAVNAYLVQKRAEPGDTIRHAFLHSGFFTDQYEDWLDVVPDNRD